jgi:hypothetical protein
MQDIDGRDIQAQDAVFLLDCYAGRGLLESDHWIRGRPLAEGSVCEPNEKKRNPNPTPTHR